MTQFQNAKYSKMNLKAQFKIQQMAFVLVALMVFFGIVAVFYISIRFSSLQEDVTDIRKEEVIESVRKMAGTPEFISSNWEDCASCVDLDKAWILKDKASYQDFWQDISLLQVLRVYPSYDTDECTDVSYPRCNKITLTDKGNYEAYEAFVSLCRYDSAISQVRCELGKVVMGFEAVGNEN